MHQIQSGQVIVDLCSVVKELIENSLDAEATSIGVFFSLLGMAMERIHERCDPDPTQKFDSKIMAWIRLRCKIMEWGSPARITKR